MVSKKLEFENCWSTAVMDLVDGCMDGWMDRWKPDLKNCLVQFKINYVKVLAIKDLAAFYICFKVEFLRTDFRLVFVCYCNFFPWTLICKQVVAYLHQFIIFYILGTVWVDIWHSRNFSFLLRINRRQLFVLKIGSKESFFTVFKEVGSENWIC